MEDEFKKVREMHESLMEYHKERVADIIRARNEFENSTKAYEKQREETHKLLDELNESIDNL